MDDISVFTINKECSLKDDCYNIVKKYDILNNKLKLGAYIKAEPIDENRNSTTFYGFLTKITIEKNLYSKTTLTLKYSQNDKIKFIKIYAIKYDIYYKTIEDKKRKIFIQLLENLGKKKSIKD